MPRCFLLGKRIRTTGPMGNGRAAASSCICPYYFVTGQSGLAWKGVARGGHSKIPVSPDPGGRKRIEKIDQDSDDKPDECR